MLQFLPHKLRIASAIIVVACLSAFFIEIRPSHKNSGEANSQSSTEAYGCNASFYSPLINHSSAETAEHGACEKSRKEEEKSKLDRRIADATDDLASFTYWLFVATFLVAGLTGVIVVFGLLQMRDTQAALKISRQGLIASQRAWIRVSLTPRGAWVESEDAAQSRFSTMIGFRLENVGDGPAVDVHVDMSIIISPTEGTFVQSDLQQIRNRADSRERADRGLVVYPHDVEPADVKVTKTAMGRLAPIETRIDPNYLVRNVRLSQRHFTERAKDPYAKFLIFIAGCAVYKVATDMETNHITDFVWQVNFDGDSFFLQNCSAQFGMEVT